MIKRLPRLPVLKSEAQAYPKPKDAPKPKLGAFKTYPDGRQVCRKNAAGKHEYRMRTLAMAEKQNWLCPLHLCRLSYAEMTPYTVTFQHGKTRGMGGSTEGGAFRDDRIDIKGNYAMHAICNAFYASRRTI